MPDSTVTPDDTFEAAILLGVLAQIRTGDYTARMPLDCTGVAGKVADGITTG